MTATNIFSPGSKRLKRLSAGKHAGRAVFIKQALRVGRWIAAEWDVTHKTLDAIAENFRVQQSRGIRVPVVWEHDDVAESKLGEVIDVWVEGDWLWVKLWVGKPEDVAHLEAVQPEVSVGVDYDWVDGLGNSYPMALVHVGIVNGPVCYGQGEFVRVMKLRNTKRRRLKMPDTVTDDDLDLDNADPADVDPEGVVDDPVADDEPEEWVIRAVELFQPLVETVYGTKIPASVDTEKELVQILEVLASQAKKAAEETTETDLADIVDDAPPEAIPDETMRLKLRQATDRYRLAIKTRDNALKQMRLKLAADKQKRLRLAKAKYRQAVDAATESGQIDPAEGQRLMRLGRRVDYSMSLVSHFANSAPRANAGSKTKRLRNSQPNATPAQAAVQAEQDRLRKRFGIG